MNIEPYCTPETAANDIQSLLAYLSDQDKGQFLYRGQIRDYDAPLHPSVFRWILDHTNIGKMPSLKEHGVVSLRSLGTTFIGNYVNNASNCINSEECRTKERREGIQQKLLNTFGYVFGTAFAQHYGFKSGGLDASSRLDVAAFFATHTVPDYKPVYLHDKNNLHGGHEGVIFRFERCTQPQQSHELMKLTYFNVPGTLLLRDALETFESDIDLGECWRNLRYYYELFRTSGDRHFDLLKIPRNMAANSRIGKQAAAIIIPDEIHLFSKEPVYCAHPIFGTPTFYPDQRKLLFQSIEDLRTRPGTTAFYFKHSDIPPDLEISACELWPNESDELLFTLAYILSPSFSCYGSLGEEIDGAYDLFDPGVNSLNHLSIENSIKSRQRRTDDFKDTLYHACFLHEDGERLHYYLYKAAHAFVGACMSRSEDLMQLSINLCDQALMIDKMSIVLMLFRNILYDTLGEKGKAQVALASAFDILEAERRPDQDPMQSIEIIKNIHTDLYFAARSPSSFPRVLWEYYQTF